MAKPSLSVIIGQMKADKSGQDPRKKQSALMALLGPKEDEEAPESEQFQSAMNDFIMAVHKHDAVMACEAFKDLQTLCPKGKAHEDDEDYIANDEHQASLEED